MVETSVPGQVPSAAPVPQNDAHSTGNCQSLHSTRRNIHHTGETDGNRFAAHIVENVASSDENDTNGNQGEGDTPTTPATRNRNDSRSSQRARVYRLPYRSAKYAILIALREGLTVGKTSMQKTELANAAQQYCDAPMLTPHNGYQNTWFDG